jgi:hypothetical protein
VKCIDSGDPNVLVYRQPTGWGVVISLPLFLALVGFTVWWWGFWAVEMAKGSPWALVLFGVFALLFLIRLLADFDKAFVRVGVTIDRNAGVVSPEWGFLVPVATDDIPLSAVRSLRLTSVTTQRRSSFSTEYRLDLLTVGGRSVRIGRGSSRAEVEAMMNRVSDFLGLG